MNKLLLALCLFSPALLCAETKVLIDAIPAGATFVGAAPINLPFKNPGSEDPKKIEAGLNNAVKGILEAVAKQGASYLCLISSPGDQPIAVPIAVAKGDLKISRTSPLILAVLYNGGNEATTPINYSTSTPDEKAPRVSSTFKKASTPPEVSMAAWIYHNLTRIQAQAEKEKSPAILVAVSGNGPSTAIPIPGMKAPLLVPQEDAAFVASWYVSPETLNAIKEKAQGRAAGADGQNPGK